MFLFDAPTYLRPSSVCGDLLADETCIAVTSLIRIALRAQATCDAKRPQKYFRMLSARLPITRAVQYALGSSSTLGFGSATASDQGSVRRHRLLMS